MRKERRRFDHIIHNFRQHDYHTTWDTIEKYNLNDDVVITLEDGSELITSQFMAKKLRKRQKE